MGDNSVILKEIWLCLSHVKLIISVSSIDNILIEVKVNV